MTKKAIRGIVAATMISAGTAVCMNVNTTKVVNFSDASLANIEALAQNEDDQDTPYQSMGYCNNGTGLNYMCVSRVTAEACSLQRLVYETPR